MYFVGITGRAKAGKHVVGGIMAAAFNDMGYTAKLDAFGLDIKCELDAADSDFNKDENRRTMQHIGAALRRQDPYCLIDNLKRRNGIGIEPFAHIWQTADILIVPDVRDEKEYHF
ncbi:MAG: hypothetical protein LUG50_13190 [Planctomycetaceae bacterium]|nr:hypothetical protein [Planctomycetaceae bacterium]